jgi:hypothetical protein
MTGSQRLQVASVALWALMITAVYCSITHACESHFLYSLDDPYIHLALARNILRGNFGVNLSEVSSASSSIAWPWILAAGEFLGLRTWTPLAINLLFALASMAVLNCLVLRLFPVTRSVGWLGASAIALAVIFLTSAVALPFTGLEHSLHVFLVIVALDGLIRVVDGSTPSVWSLLALVMIGLTRFEGLAFSSAALAALWFTRHRGRATMAAALLVASLAAYAAFMHRLGLPLIPSSVLLKAGSQGGGVLSAVMGRAITFHSSDRPFVLLYALIICLMFWYTKRHDQSLRVFFVPVTFSLLAHLAAGAYGGFYRYEVYAVVTAVVAMMFVFARLRAAGQLPIPAGILAGLVITVLLQVDFPYAYAALSTPSASRSIYSQQYQMRRFARDYYRQPVGVNDLGLVAYDNDRYTLDLFGLGSEEVRKLKVEREYGSKAMAELTDRHGVGLVMIYPQWFPQIPANWTEVAVLHTPPGGTAAYPDVHFYATGRRDAGVYDALTRFSQSLPSGVVLSIAAVDGAPDGEAGVCPSSAAPATRTESTVTAVQSVFGPLSAGV